MGQWRARKGCRSSYINYLKRLSVCLIRRRCRLPQTSSWGESKLSGGSRLLETNDAKLNMVAAGCPEPELRSPVSNHHQGHPILPLLQEALFIGMWGTLATLSKPQFNNLKLEPFASAALFGGAWAGKDGVTKRLLMSDVAHSGGNMARRREKPLPLLQLP